MLRDVGIDEELPFGVWLSEQDLAAYLSPSLRSFFSSSSTLGRLFFRSSGSAVAIRYSETPMGAFELQRAYSAMSFFLVPHRMMPMLGLSSGCRTSSGNQKHRGP